MENAEFINTYIDTLNKNLHEAVSRNAVLETRLTMSEKLAASLQSEIQSLRSELEKVNKKKPVTTSSE